MQKMREVIVLKNEPELFASMAFNKTVMRERLPKDVFKALKRAIQLGV